MIAVDVRKRLREYELAVALDVGPGEVVSMVGPTGCGKTTTLRLVAGLETPDDGRIEIDGRTVVDVAKRVWVAPQQRRLGVVFQDYALFPHLTALANAEFGARARGWTRRRARERARASLEAVGLSDQEAILPCHLSGGQQQRVALARALASDPAALLMDEPLSALDAKTRREVRSELRSFLGGLACPAIVVTHDVVDALTLGDRVCVMQSGSVAQVGTRSEMVSRPRSAFVAEFLGVNLLSGHATRRGPDHTEVRCGEVVIVSTDEADGPVSLTFSPWDVTLSRRQPEGSARNLLLGHVSSITYLGGRVRVALEAGVPLVAEVSYAACEEMAVRVGDVMHAAIKASAVRAH